MIAALVLRVNGYAECRSKGPRPRRSPVLLPSANLALDGQPALSIPF